MSKNLEVGGQGSFGNFEDLLKFYKSASEQLPKGISFKRQGNYLYLQFVHPGTGKRLPKPCDVAFTYEGIVKAKEKAYRVRHALDTILSVTEFWEWYGKEILDKKNEIIDDRITYREIFEKIEQKYWRSNNKNTGRKRLKDLPNDVATYHRHYTYVFNRFPDWDKQPNWQDLKTVLFSWEQGSHAFEGACSTLKNIISYCPNSDKLLALLSDVDGKQTEFKVKQSISLDQFLKWHQSTLDDAGDRYRESRESWLWVCSMCVVYGLRPSEIAAAENLTKPFTKDGITIPALNNPGNTDLLLVLADRTYFGATIKTGGRICKPMTTDKQLIERLGIRFPALPEFKPDKDSKAETVSGGFSGACTKRLTSWKCPVTQAYAFRHLANQLGEKCGIPQEIRARSLGHSVSVNETTYKKRSNFQTSIDLLVNHSKQPLSLEVALHQLESIGFDLDDPSVNAVLKVIYQLN